MNKITPYVDSAEINEQKKSKHKEEKCFLMNPSDETVNKILQYAAAYKTELVTQDKNIKYSLN